MKIKLMFHGSLKKYNHHVPEMEMELPNGSMVGQLFRQIEVPKEEIAFVSVNGSRAPLSQVLEDGDEVKLFQLVGGG